MLAWIKALAARTRAWFSPRETDQEFESELESHLENAYGRKRAPSGAHGFRCVGL
jgi:hypothetical protein